MRKIPKKDASDIPASIALPDSLPTDADGHTKQKAETTHKRRVEVIQSQKFPKKEAIFTDRYKQDDLKDFLEKHYNDKCCYCERNEESGDVEHYRPTSVYYWLAYSWDNLLFACRVCNGHHKKDKFAIQGTRASYQASDLPDIHSLCEKYNQTEQPKLLHPEFDNFEGIWEFDRAGVIYSQDARGIYTIETCKLDRKKLNKRRWKIIDNFKKKLESLRKEFSKEEDEQKKEGSIWIIILIFLFMINIYKLKTDVRKSKTGFLSKNLLILEYYVNKRF